MVDKRKAQGTSPAFDSDQIMARMRWLTVVLPLCFLLVLLVLEVQYLNNKLSAPVAILLGFSVSAVGIVFFSRSVFEVVERLQERLREQNASLEQRSRQLEAVQAAGLQVASHIDLQTVLQALADSSRRLVGARYAAIAVVKDGGIEDVVTSGLSDEEKEALASQTLPHLRGVIGHVVETGGPYRTGDIENDPHSFGFPDGHPVMKQFMGVPVLSGGKVIGNIYLTDREGGDFTDEDERVIGMLALQAAIAIENARLFEEGRQVAVLKERERIGMELHDGAIQALYGLSLKLEGCLDSVESQPDHVVEELDGAIEDVNAIIRDFRSHIFDLRPRDTQGRSLRDSLQELLLDLAVNTLIHTELAVQDNESCPDPSEGLSLDQVEKLFLVAEETLDNVRKLADARNVRLEIGRDGGKFWMRITDDGAALNENGRSSSEGGIKRIAEWVSAMDGELAIDHGPERGTTISVSIPRTAIGELGP